MNIFEAVRPYVDICSFGGGQTKDSSLGDGENWPGVR